MEGQEYPKKLAENLKNSLNAKDPSQLVDILQMLKESGTQLQISFSYKCSYHEILGFTYEQSLISSRENMYALECQCNHMFCLQCTKVYFRQIFLSNGLNSLVYCPICHDYNLQELRPVPISPELIQFVLSQEEIQHLAKQG